MENQKWLDHVLSPVVPGVVAVAVILARNFLPQHLQLAQSALLVIGGALILWLAAIDWWSIRQRGDHQGSMTHFLTAGGAILAAAFVVWLNTDSGWLALGTALVVTVLLLPRLICGWRQHRAGF